MSRWPGKVQRTAVGTKEYGSALGRQLVTHQPDDKLGAGGRGCQSEIAFSVSELWVLLSIQRDLRRPSSAPVRPRSGVPRDFTGKPIDVHIDVAHLTQEVFAELRIFPHGCASGPRPITHALELRTILPFGSASQSKTIWDRVSIKFVRRSPCFCLLEEVLLPLSYSAVSFFPVGGQPGCGSLAIDITFGSEVSRETSVADLRISDGPKPKRIHMGETQCRSSRIESISVTYDTLCLGSARPEQSQDAV